MAGYPLQKIISDGHHEVLEQLHYLSDVYRMGIGGFLPSHHVTLEEDKSCGLTSGEQGGQMKSDMFDISLPGKRSSRHSPFLLLKSRLRNHLTVTKERLAFLSMMVPQPKLQEWQCNDWKIAFQGD